MYDHYPFGCTSAHITESDPFVEPWDAGTNNKRDRIGLCACCADVCYQEDDCLALTNGVLCTSCLSTLPREELVEWIGAIAPLDWDEKIVRMLANRL